MDDSQAAFAQPYPPYSFDIDMMKRSMDPAGGPDSKKARWSPTSGAPPATAPGASPRDVYANYGYGGQTGQSPLYSTPQLSINTQNVNGGGQLSPNTLASFQQQQQQQQQSPVAGSPYNQFSPYNMLAMGSFPYPQQNFQQQRLPTLNIPAAQAVYNPSALSGLLSAGGTPSVPTAGRTVYIGNLPPSASVDELLNLVHFGPLESIRVLPEKSCVFLSFLDASTAAAFFADAALRKLTLHNQELKVGWGKPSPVPAQVLQAIAQSGASRNVYLGGLDEGMTEEALRDELSKFGLIDQVKIVRDKNIGFVHFLSISVATKVVNTLPTDPAWAGKRVNYGKDRCAYVPKSQQAAAHQAQAAAAQSLLIQSTFSPLASSAAASFASPTISTGGFGSFAGMGGYGGSPASAHPGSVGASSNPFGAAAPASGPHSAHPTSGGNVNPILSGAALAAQQASAGGANGSGAGTSPGGAAQGQGAQNGTGNAGQNGQYGAGAFSPDALSAMMGMGMFGGMGMGGQMMSPMSPGGLGMLGMGVPGLGLATGNRTVYLGNIHPETTTEDLCNAIRGGVLQSVRYMADKHIAFITFIDPAAAFTFFQVSSYHGLTLNNRRLKIGWGKNSGPLPPTLALAVHAGATRNVYIGNVEDFEVFSEERLKADFGEFGDIELVNFLKEKNCAFVNFTNISNAIKAIDAIKNRPEYANLRIAHGKDRCANPPRSGPQGASGSRRNASGNGGPNSAEPVSAVEPEGEMDFDVEAVQAEMETADGEVKQEQHEEGMAVEGGVAASS